jgi:hypothetical protein
MCRRPIQMDRQRSSLGRADRSPDSEREMWASADTIAFGRLNSNYGIIRIPARSVRMADTAAYEVRSCAQGCAAPSNATRAFAGIGHPAFRKETAPACAVANRSLGNRRYNSVGERVIGLPDELVRRFSPGWRHVSGQRNRKPGIRTGDLARAGLLRLVQ